MNKDKIIIDFHWLKLTGEVLRPFYLPWAVGGWILESILLVLQQWSVSFAPFWYAKGTSFNAFPLCPCLFLNKYVVEKSDWIWLIRQLKARWRVNGMWWFVWKYIVERQMLAGMWDSFVLKRKVGCEGALRGTWVEWYDNDMHCRDRMRGPISRSCYGVLGEIILK